MRWPFCAGQDTGGVLCGGIGALRVPNGHLPAAPTEAGGSERRGGPSPPGGWRIPSDKQLVRAKGNLIGITI